MIFIKFDKEEDFDIDLLQPSDSVDVVGYIYTDPEFNEDGKVVKKSKLIPGFHVNLIAEEIPEGWKKYVIERPSNPKRVFFGY